MSNTVWKFDYYRYSLGTRGILGLISYLPTQQGEEQTETKRKKKNKDKTLGGDDSSSLMMVPMSQTLIIQLPEYSSLETLTYSAILMVLVFVAYSAAASIVPFGTTSLLLSASVFLMSLVSLLVVSFLSSLTSSEDKIYAIFYSSLSFIACIAYFGLEPEGLFLWSPEGAATAAANMVQRAVQHALVAANVDVDDSFLDTIQAPLSLLGVIFAVLAAFITAVLHSAALRFARAFHAHTCPPTWVTPYMTRSWMDSTRIRVQMIAPMMLVPLYMTMLMKEILGLDDTTCSLVQAASLIVTGILFILNTRILVSRYLETALIAWYTVKHSQYRTKPERAAAQSVVKAKADVVRYTACKTAIQALAPGVLYLSCGLLTLGSYMYTKSSTGIPEIAQLASTFVGNAVGFVVSFVGVLWFIVCGFSIWLFRTGTILY